MRVTERGFSMAEFSIILAMGLVLSAVSVAPMGTALMSYRLAGDARDLSGHVTLSRMRAAAEYAQGRLKVDLAGGSAQVELCLGASPCTWTSDGPVQTLSQGVSFGFGSISTPAGFQTTISQAPACLDSSGNPIANTACIVFNSRGIPVDSTGTPLATGALYLTDGNSVYAVTVSATGLIQTWRIDRTLSSWQSV